MAWIRCTGNTGGSLKVRTASGAIASFETNMVDVLQSVKCEINATGGNGTPDNPNPINGYTEANITRCGVNLWDEQWELGTIDSNGVNQPTTSAIRSKNYIPIKGNRNMYQGIGENNNHSSYIVAYFYDVNKTFIPYTGTGAYNNGANPSNGLFTSPENAVYMKIRIVSAYGTTYNNDIISSFSSTTVPYTPYNGQTYAIAFGQEVYGGSLDVTRGVLTVTYGQVNLGSLAWTKDTTTIVGQTFFRAMLSDAKNAFKAICSDYPFVGSYSNLVDKSCAYVYNTRIAIMDSDYDSYTDGDFKTAMSGKVLAYELATPFDIDLTPQQIEALLGVNNIWHDANGDTEVKYLEIVRS